MPDFQAPPQKHMFALHEKRGPLLTFLFLGDLSLLPLGPKPRPKAPSERNVFRLLGTNFAVQLLTKPPLRGQGSAPLKGNEDPGPGGGASKKKVDGEIRTQKLKDVPFRRGDLSVE